MPSVAIDCFHEHLPVVAADSAIVAIDVIRATTTAVTAAALGQRVYPAGSIEAAVRLAADLDRPLLAGELGGVQPYGFDLQNSPSQIEALTGTSRPIILLSTSGTRLIAEAASHGITYVACLRNAAAQAAQLAEEQRDVLILGADSRGEFREEDQLCAARIADALVQRGYVMEDDATKSVHQRWAGAPDEAFVDGRSAHYLRDTGQEEDLRFVLDHVDDLSAVFVLEERAIQPVAPLERRPAGELPSSAPGAPLESA
jgi:2-phosphosulfolactate phosphatase